MREIIEELTEINKQLFAKFGTDSYEIRCKIYDIQGKLNTIKDDTQK